MDPLHFAYWLQGYFELLDADAPLTAKQARIIKDHLAQVFVKVTPDRSEEPDVWPGDKTPAKEEQKVAIDKDFIRPDVTCTPEQLRREMAEEMKKLREKRHSEWDTHTWCFANPLDLKLC